jgi:coproporphyrinogen III oxidase-like Fe-S oxidoreductase
MNLDLSPQELEVLLELVESSINRIEIDIQNTKNSQKKIELKEHKEEELVEIFKKIESLQGRF